MDRYLTGTITEETKFDPNDNRGTFPRFSPEALRANRRLVEVIQAFARQKRATPAQIALAFLLAQKPWIVPIPGTTKLSRLDENIGSTHIELTADDLQELDRETSEIPVEGDRYPPEIERMTYR
jgi:aryl-alcohol dehydrogenase-like predicted oxidoreductase